MDRLPFSPCWRWVAWLLVLTAGIAIVGLDVQRYRTVLKEQRAQTDEEEARDQELERRRVLLLGRNQARVDIAWDVINGRMTLIAAIDQFRALESSRPDFVPVVPAPDWCVTDEERFVAQIRLYVEQVLLREPDRRKAVLKRLEKEWRERSSGRIPKQGLGTKMSSKIGR